MYNVYMHVVSSILVIYSYLFPMERAMKSGHFPTGHSTHTRGRGAEITTTVEINTSCNNYYN